MTDAPPAILVAACGNALGGDDAVGPLVLDALRAHAGSRARLLDLKTAPAMLLDHLARCQRLILIDAAVIPDRQAGEVMVCDWNSPDRPALVSESPLSTHGLSLSTQIELAEALGALPQRVTLVAIAIAGANREPGLSAPVRRAIPIAVDCVRKLMS